MNERVHDIRPTSGKAHTGLFDRLTILVGY